MRPRELASRHVWSAVLAALLVLLAVPVAGPVLAVSYASPVPTTAAPASAATSLALGTGTSATLGTYLTGPTGDTLYWLSSDTAGGATCTAACLAAWPPLTVSAGESVSAPSGVSGPFVTFTRADTQAMQVAYDGHPLYYFAHDGAAGQTNGEGIMALGGTWHVALVAAASTSAGPTASAPAASASAATGGSLPPTTTGSPRSGGASPGDVPALFLLLALAIAATVALGVLPRRARRG